MTHEDTECSEIAIQLEALRSSDKTIDDVTRERMGRLVKRLNSECTDGVPSDALAEAVVTVAQDRDAQLQKKGEEEKLAIATNLARIDVLDQQINALKKTE